MPAAASPLVNTPGTQGYCRICQGQQIKTDDSGGHARNELRHDPGVGHRQAATLKDAERVLLSVVARNANTGMRILTVDGKTVVENGKAPMLLEPVKAQHRVPRPSISEVRVLGP